MLAEFEVRVLVHLNRVIVNLQAGATGGPNLTPELRLQFLRDRTEFDWRFWRPARQAKERRRMFSSAALRLRVLGSTVLLVDGED
jgi:hypothetical protein